MFSGCLSVCACVCICMLAYTHICLHMLAEAEAFSDWLATNF